MMAPHDPVYVYTNGQPCSKWLAVCFCGSDDCPDAVPEIPPRAHLVALFLTGQSNASKARSIPAPELEPLPPQAPQKITLPRLHHLSRLDDWARAVKKEARRLRVWRYIDTVDPQCAIDPRDRRSAKRYARTARGGDFYQELHDSISPNLLNNVAQSTQNYKYAENCQGLLRAVFDLAKPVAQKDDDYLRALYDTHLAALETKVTDIGVSRWISEWEEGMDTLHAYRATCTQQPHVWFKVLVDAAAKSRFLEGWARGKKDFWYSVKNGYINVSHHQVADEMLKYVKSKSAEMAASQQRAQCPVCSDRSHTEVRKCFYVFPPPWWRNRGFLPLAYIVRRLIEFPDVLKEVAEVAGRDQDELLAIFKSWEVRQVPGVATL